MPGKQHAKDIAYSFGIFKVPISVNYGGGNQAARRLLEYILTRFTKGDSGA